MNSSIPSTKPASTPYSYQWSVDNTNDDTGDPISGTNKGDRYGNSSGILASESDEDVILERLFGILDNVEGVMAADPFSIEPRPIGPGGVGFPLNGSLWDLDCKQGAKSAAGATIPDTAVSGLFVCCNNKEQDTLSQQHHFWGQGPLIPDELFPHSEPRANKRRKIYSPIPQMVEDEYQQDLQGMLSLFCSERGDELLSSSAIASSAASNTTAATSLFPLVTMAPNERGGNHFRQYQTDQWNDRFQDLLSFKQKNGHLFVPHNFPANQPLAQWTKRQRYQYKLKHEMNRHSTLTDERERKLVQAGFIWDSHKAAWNERLFALKLFKAEHGDCNVPSNFADRALAIWVKCQRRQYRLLHIKGRRSTMTQERIAELEAIGFDWNPRNL